MELIFGIQKKFIFHDAVGHSAYFAEFLIEPHEVDKFLLFIGPEDELAINDAKDAMVVDLGIMGRDFETGFEHVVECEIGGKGSPCAKKSKAFYCYQSVTLFFT